jgi:glyoxylase-like metal-dependent hydrolase (beta-lactamase superfamily II)
MPGENFGSTTGSTQLDPFSIDAFVEDPEVVQVTDNTYFCTYFSGVTAFDTSEGLVLVDTASSRHAPDIAEAIREHTDSPVHTIIYTHGHLDHAYGAEEYLVEGQEDPRIIAHEAMPDRWERYARTSGHGEAINARQFGGTHEANDYLSDEQGSRFRPPDYTPTTLYQDSLTIEVGDTTFEIRHGKGETDDHSWVYCPDREVLCPGDLFISVSPNAGNPQKVQRYAWLWADALEKMAGRTPRHLCPGHGHAVVDDTDGIEDRLLSTASYLNTIVDGTISALNDGSPPHVDIVHEVDIPDAPEEWLTESYDEGEFIVRNIIRYFGGWWSGRPSELKPSPRTTLAAELAEMVGSPEALAERGVELVEEGELRLGCHLADYALEAAPSDSDVQSMVADIYDHRAALETNLMAANLYSSAAEYARQGRPFK